MRHTEFPIETQAIDQLKFGLNKIVRNRLNASKASEKPFIIHMLGIPGAGKSVIARSLYGTLLSQSVNPVAYVGFDKIMSEIPSYKSTDDIVEAFSKFELPARAAGYSLVRSLIIQKSSFLFDHGGSDKEHIDILSYAKVNFDYTTVVVYVSVDEQTALERAKERSKKENRHTPPEYITKRKAKILRLIDKYRDVSDFFFEIPNNTAEDLCLAVSNTVVNITHNITD